jgi:uncharacterized repeat protein (TIGR03803 family)
MAHADASKGQVTILHHFGDVTVWPYVGYPSSGLIQAADDSFLGVATINDCSPDAERTGIVFQCWSTGHLKLLLTFLHRPLLGPIGPLLLYNGDLIGICGAGRGNGRGAVFRLRFSKAVQCWRMISCRRFFPADIGDDLIPNAPLILGADDYLYGTAYEGGLARSGLIFSLDPDDHVFTVVHRFHSNSGGIDPVAPLLLANDGNYYGTTSYGPGDSASGTIFMMTPAGKVTTLYTYPFRALGSAPLIQGRDGNLYGATVSGGVFGSGTVYKIACDRTVSILHSFGPQPDGIFPIAIAQGPDGKLYGTTNAGGTANKGTVFEISADGSSYAVLHHFGDGTIPNDGAVPDGCLTLGSDGNFYGVTVYGGSGGRGTIFKLSL